MIADTGKWLFTHAIFDEWVKGGQWLLWISGHEGFGKTYLSTGIIGYLGNLHTTSIDRVGVGHFYVRKDNASRRTVPIILRTMAMQLASTNLLYAMFLSTTLQDIVPTTVSDLWQGLFVEYFVKRDLRDQACLVIDGIDEAEPSGDDSLNMFFRVLRSFHDGLGTANGNSRLRLLFVGRPAAAHQVTDDRLLHSCASTIEVT
jgi:hypothetical protein